MAKYIITHSCGCTEEVQLFGKLEDRERRIKSMEQTICVECWNKKTEKESRKRGLPELAGSHKQIMWATSIRYAMLENFPADLERLANSCTDDKRREDGVMRFNDIKDRIITRETAASFWIDSRYDTLIDLVKEEIRSSNK